MAKPGPRSAPRDERGWRIPRAGTYSSRIYTALVAGKSYQEITQFFPDMSRTTLSVLIWKIKHPDEANDATIRQRRKRNNKQNLACI